MSRYLSWGQVRLKIKDNIMKQGKLRNIAVAKSMGWPPILMDDGRLFVKYRERSAHAVGGILILQPDEFEVV